MCIICAKKSGVEMPSLETMRIMWNNNDDGAGIMWNENNKVCIRKGFMKFEDFKDFVEELSNRIDIVNTSVVMHFRITTHGGTKPENCHPFPISDNVCNLQKLKFSADIGMAHNGIINTVTPRDGVSDTMEFILSKVSLMRKISPRFYKNDGFKELINLDINGSRIAFLDKDGNIETIGNFIEEDGLLYSTTSYKASLYNFSNYPYASYYSYWDMDYCDYPTEEDDKFSYMTYSINAMPVASVGGFAFNEDTGEEIFGETYLDDTNWLYVRDDSLDAITPVDYNFAVMTYSGDEVLYDASKAEPQKVMEKYIESPYNFASYADNDECMTYPEDDDDDDVVFSRVEVLDESYAPIVAFAECTLDSVINMCQHVIGTVDYCSDTNPKFFNKDCDRAYEVATFDEKDKTSDWYLILCNY